jgi:hypothetical protein
MFVVKPTSFVNNLPVFQINLLHNDLLVPT